LTGTRKITDELVYFYIGAVNEKQDLNPVMMLVRFRLLSWNVELLRFNPVLLLLLISTGAGDSTDAVEIMPRDDAKSVGKVL